MPQSPEERYEIRRRIGSGGIGAVYEALDRRLGRIVAIKRLLPPDESEDRGGIGQDLLKEARTLSSFQHPNIVTILDVGSDDDGVYIVMEFIDGSTVDQAVKPLPMAMSAFLRFAEQMLDGLIAAHSRDLLHRDIKPSNVMLERQRDGVFQVKILDFGIAKFSRRPALQTVDHSQSILGSIYFMAPEQFERRPLDARTDLYQLGCLFFFALTGSHPFDGESTAAIMNAHLSAHHRSLAEQRSDIPPAVIGWIESHYRCDAGSRPASASDSLASLHRVVRALGAPLPGSPPTRPVAASVRRPPQVPPLVAAPAISSSSPAATTRVPRTIAPGTNPPAVALPSPPGRQGPAKSASLPPRRPPDRAVPRNASAETNRRRRVRLMATLGIVAVGLGLVLHFRNPGGGAGTTSSQGSAGNGDPSLPAALANPPALDRLFVRLDAAEGTFRNAEEAPSDFGDPVAAWKDLAPLGGNNFAQYFVTTTPDVSKHWPKLVRSATGSRGRSLEFNGSQRLIVGRQDGGDPILVHAQASHFTLLVALQVSTLQEGGREFVLGWKDASGSEQVALSVSGTETALSLTLTESDAPSSVTRPLRPGETEVLIIDRGVVDDRSRLRLFVAHREHFMESGAAAEAPVAVTDLRELRLGQVLNPGRAGSGTPFSGRLHGVLLYIGELSPDELASAIRFLQARSGAWPAAADR